MSSRMEAEAAAIDGEEAPLVPSFLTAGEMLAEFPDLREPIVDGLMRRGEVMNFIAAPKVGKSWLVLHLLLCIATGRMFLNRFRVARGRVLLLDNELHGQTIAKRIKTVADAMGLLHEEYAANLVIECLRGKSATLDRLLPYAEKIGSGQFDLVCIDAWYRALPKGTEENANADMTTAYNMVDTFARSLDASVVLIHHASKGNQSDKAITDVGAGAGAQSRAADSHLIIRRHEEDNAVVVEAVARSWPPPEAFGMRWQYPLWTVDPGLDVTRLLKPGKQKPKTDNEAPPPEPPEEWDVEKWVATFITPEPKPKKLVFARAKMVPSLSERQSHAIYDVALADKLIFEWRNTDTPPVLVVSTKVPDLMDMAGIGAAEDACSEPPKRRGRPRKKTSETAENGGKNAA